MPAPEVADEAHRAGLRARERAQRRGLLAQALHRRVLLLLVAAELALLGEGGGGGRAQDVGELGHQLLGVAEGCLEFGLVEAAQRRFFVGDLVAGLRDGA